MTIHRNGDKYRFWSNVCDRYAGEIGSRDELVETLRQDAFAVVHLAGDAIRIRLPDSHIEPTIVEVLRRLDVNGTSSAREVDKRPTDRWDDERCNRCDNFHHAYEPGSTGKGKCAACGEGKQDKSHKPPCEVVS